MDCAEADVLLDELALDVLPGDRRAAIIAHLEVCPGCRSLLDELSETADTLLLTGPKSEPPPGFHHDVMARLRTARPRHRPRFAAVAVVAVAVVLLSGAVAVGVRTHQPDELRTVQLTSTGGGNVGDVSAYAGPPAGFFLRVQRALPTGTYRCVLDVDGGQTIAFGSLFVSESKGGWGGHASVDPRHVRAARLLDARGETVATAVFH